LSVGGPSNERLSIWVYAGNSATELKVGFVKALKAFEEEARKADRAMVARNLKADGKGGTK